MDFCPKTYGVDYCDWLVEGAEPGKEFIVKCGKEFIKMNPRQHVCSDHYEAARRVKAKETLARKRAVTK